VGIVRAKGRPLNKRTRERLAACHAVGLHFWADHPLPNHVWAVDDHQRAHVVRINRDVSTALHACRVALPDGHEQCPAAAEAVIYTVLDELTA
jgi:hypothetical protein